MSEWIEWKGGERPVEDNVRVEVLHRDGDVSSETAIEYDWDHANYEGDIIAYRIVKEKEE